MSKATRPKDAPASTPELTMEQQWIAALIAAVIIIPIVIWFNSGDDTSTAESSTAGNAAKIQECRDKIRKQLNYPAEAEFYLFSGSKVTDEFVGITFDAKNAFGMVTEYYGFCKTDGTVTITER